MSKNINWVFEPRGKGQSASGANEAARSIKSRKLSELEILGREGGQNTLNQPLDEKFNKPVKVEIKLIELTGSYKEDYLLNLKWNTLEKHIKAAAGASEQRSLSIKLKNNIKEVNDKKNSLFILNIEDSNCYGLTGPEIEDKNADKPNFFNLCKANFYTSETAKSARGGSYGVGKSILWTCSKIETVLFSSQVKESNDENKEGLRIFGRTNLATHSLKDESFRGPGYFGYPEDIAEKNLTYKMATSIWNNSDLAKKLYIDREKSKGTGATISIVGFNDAVASEYGIEGHEILIGIKEQFEKYFWPAIACSKKLDLSFVYQRNQKVRSEYDDDLKINLEKWSPFIDAYKLNLDDENNSKIANKENLISKRSLELKIPPRKKPIPELNLIVKETNNTKFEVSVKRGSKNLLKHPEANKIALIRGFGMVVEYKKPDSNPINLETPYFAVTKVGKLLGESKNEIISENFFKDSEPELHDRWDSQTEGFDNRYTKPKSILNEFYEKLDSNLLEMCGEEESEGKEGPALLSNMLNMGFRGGKKLSHQISTKNIKATTQDKYLWNVSGTIEISDYPETEKKNKDKKWTVNFGFTIKEETSRGDKIPFEKIDFFDDQSVEIDNKESGVSVTITNSKSFSFRGILDLKKILKNQNPAFCALKFYTS